MLADTHCHLDFEYLESQLTEIRSGITDARVGMLVVPSVARDNWGKVIRVCQKDSRFFFGLGLHPYFIDCHDIDDLSKLADEVERLKKEGDLKFVAIGEIGLDFTCSNIEKQVSLFEGQLALAEKYQLPVIIHTRKAHSETLSSLKKFSLVGGVVHAFSGSFELMMSYIDQGLSIGVGPVITWPGSIKTRGALMKAPIEALVLETDAPDMSVYGVRNGSGSPLNVREVFIALLNIREEAECQLEQALWGNSRSLFARRFCD